MVVHTFMIRWKPEATTADKARFLAEVRAFAGVVPGLLQVYAGLNFSERANGHQLGAVMLFRDREALDTYATSPLHLQLLSWAAPLVDATDVDFTV